MNLSLGPGVNSLKLRGDCCEHFHTERSERSVLALKTGPFRLVKYSPIFGSNLAPLNLGQYSPIS